MKQLKQQAMTPYEQKRLKYQEANSLQTEIAQIRAKQDELELQKQSLVKKYFCLLSEAQAIAEENDDEIIKHEI